MDQDILQVKIDAARALLSEDTRASIDAVDWKGEIVKMRETKGFSFEQLGDLETETELLLAGITSPEEYSKILESQMGISQQQVNELMEDMNKAIFSKIKEEFIKRSEAKKIDSRNQTITPSGIKIIKPENKASILTQKLNGSTQANTVKTDHSIQNIQTVNTKENSVKNGDPYREIPE